MLQFCFCFMFWFFGREACGILAPRPGIKPAPPALEAWSLNRWTTREVPEPCILYTLLHVGIHPFIHSSLKREKRKRVGRNGEKRQRWFRVLSLGDWRSNGIISRSGYSKEGGLIWGRTNQTLSKDTGLFFSGEGSLAEAGQCVSLLEVGRAVVEITVDGTEMIIFGFFIYDLSYLDHLLSPKSSFTTFWLHMILLTLFCFLK